MKRKRKRKKETNGERIERISSNLPHFDANEFKFIKTRKKY